MTDAELLRLRTAALARVVEQLDEVREQHRESEHFPGHCAYEGFIYPCATAKALGVTS